MALATFQVLGSHMELAVAILDSTVLGETFILQESYPYPDTTPP